MLHAEGDENVLDKRENPSPEPSDDHPLARFVTFRMSRIQAKLNAQATAILDRECGLSVIQWRAIAIIAILGETSPVAIARFGQLDKGLLSRKLKGLIADKLVKSRPDPFDQRSQLLSLTVRGRAIYDRMLPIMQARQQYLVAGLTEKELDAFLAALDKIDAASERREFQDST